MEPGIMKNIHISMVVKNDKELCSAIQDVINHLETGNYSPENSIKSDLLYIDNNEIGFFKLSSNS